MAGEQPKMDRLAERWRRASDAALSPLDMQQSRERLLAAQRELSRRRRAGRVSEWRWLAAATLTIAGVAVALFWRFGSTPYTFTVDGKPASVGAHLAADTAAELLRFSEGSTIVLARDSRLGVTDIDRRGAVVEVHTGTIDVDIAKHPEARWEIKAGPFDISVLGTAFQVVWRPKTQHFSVNVERGVIFVRGPMVESGRAIRAGTRCSVDVAAQRIELRGIGEATDAPTAGNPAPSASSSSPTPELSLPPLQVEPTPSSAPSERPFDVRPKRDQRHASASRRPSDGASWRELERTGQFDAALQAAERAGIDGIYDSAESDDLMSLARAARFVGRQDVSTGALSSCRRRFPGSRDAAMAAYLLGRNAPPAGAVKWFSAYLAEQPNGALAIEASGRLIEANEAAGDVKAARNAARHYLLRYPDGPHAQLAKRVLAN